MFCMISPYWLSTVLHLSIASRDSNVNDTSVNMASSCTDANKCTSVGITVAWLTKYLIWSGVDIHIL